MIPINNASKYHRTVAVYTATVLWYTHLCSVYTSRSFLQKQHQQCFSGERYSSVIINSYLVFSFWFSLFAFFYDNVSAIRMYIIREFIGNCSNDVGERNGKENFSLKINTGPIVNIFDCSILFAFYIVGKVRYKWIAVRDVKLNTEN